MTSNLQQVLRHLQARVQALENRMLPQKKSLASTALSHATTQKMGFNYDYRFDRPQSPEPEYLEAFYEEYRHMEVKEKPNGNKHGWRLFRFVNEDDNEITGVGYRKYQPFDITIELQYGENYSVECIQRIVWKNKKDDYLEETSHMYSDEDDDDDFYMEEPERMHFTSKHMYEVRDWLNNVFDDPAKSI